MIKGSCGGAIEGGSSANELLISGILAVKWRKNECGINGGQHIKEGQDAFYPFQTKPSFSRYSLGMPNGS